MARNSTKTTKRVDVLHTSLPINSDAKPAETKTIEQSSSVATASRGSSLVDSNAPRTSNSADPESASGKTARPTSFAARVQRFLLRRRLAQCNARSSTAISIATVDDHFGDTEQATPAFRPSLSSRSSTSAARHVCPICLDEFPIADLVNVNACGHRSCGECFETYLRTEIVESRVDLRCPECAQSLEPSLIEEILRSDSALIEKYRTFMIRRVLAKEADARWCPAPDCMYAVIASGCASCPKLHCQSPNCGTDFCYNCKQLWHPDSTCQAAHLRNQALQIQAQGDVPAARQGQIKPCPRCRVQIAKLEDGSCNHMSCPMCGADFCWLCMKEISDMHFLSPSGCTFWGKRPWSRKKKLLCQLGTLIGAPVGIALLAGVAVPAILIGVPVYVSRKIYREMKMRKSKRWTRNVAVAAGAMGATIVSPVLAALAVGAGVPCMVAYVYGVVPIALLRNGGACGIERSDLGEHIDIDDVREEPATSPIESANATGSLPLRTKAISSEVRPTSSQKRAALSIGSDAGAADSHTSTRVDRLGAKKKTSKSVFRQRRSSAGSESLSASIGGRSDNASTRALAGSIAGRNHHRESDTCRAEVHTSSAATHGGHKVDSVSLAGLSRDAVSLAESNSLHGSVSGFSLPGSSAGGPQVTQKPRGSQQS